MLKNGSFTRNSTRGRLLQGKFWWMQIRLIVRSFIFRETLQTCLRKIIFLLRLIPLCYVIKDRRAATGIVAILHLLLIPEIVSILCLLDRVSLWQLKNKRPTWCHLLFYFTSYVLNMFRTLIYPSSGACDYSVELPHWSYCSWFDMCWRFGVVGLEWYPCCRLKHISEIKKQWHQVGLLFFETVSINLLYCFKEHDIRKRFVCVLFFHFWTKLSNYTKPDMSVMPLEVTPFHDFCLNNWQ